MVSVNKPAMRSSAMKGRASAPAKGQPKALPMANHAIPWAVLILRPDQSMNDANPSIAQFMAKLDGRYAGAA